MRHVIVKPGRDPLLAFVLASLGIVQAVGCGGQSERQSEAGELETGGTAGVGAGAVGGVGTGGVSGTAGAGVGAGSAAGAPPVNYPKPPGVAECVLPTSWPAEETGFELCGNGFFHRPSIERCPPAPSLTGDTFGNCEGESACQNGERCIPATSCSLPRCVRACEVDADCAANELCFCDYAENHCVKAACKLDSDCGEGLLCVLVRDPYSLEGEFVCQNSDDECTAECPSFNSDPGGNGRFYSGTCGTETRADGSTQRTCSYQLGTGGSCGRPFLIDGHETLATARSSADWLDPRASAPRLDELDPALRQALAVQWRDAALMEHASIAAFARFTLELLALGAPPSLVEDATEAMADEQRHATLCFALASAYAGAPLGPGPLDVRGALTELELESVVVTTFLEGCIGETIAAVEARELARRVTDPTLERVLSRIAADESRHAALAWRFVHWALERGAPTLVTRLRAELALAQASAAVAQSHATPPSRTTAASNDSALAHGLVPPAFRGELRRSALSEIVAPCLEALADFARIAEDSRESAA